MRDAAGNIVRWYGTQTDIEDLKQTEEKLRAEDCELRRITDAIPQAIVVQDPSGIPVYANVEQLSTTQDSQLKMSSLLVSLNGFSIQRILKSSRIIGQPRSRVDFRLSLNNEHWERTDSIVGSDPLQPISG